MEINQVITLKEEVFYDDLISQVEELHPSFLSETEAKEFKSIKYKVIQEWVDLGLTQGKDLELVFPEGTEFRISEVPYENPEQYSDSVYLIPTKSQYKFGILVDKDQLKEWI